MKTTSFEAKVTESNKGGRWAKAVLAGEGCRGLSGPRSEGHEVAVRYRDQGME